MMGGIQDNIPQKAWGAPWMGGKFITVSSYAHTLTRRSQFSTHI